MTLGDLIHGTAAVALGGAALHLFAHAADCRDKAPALAVTLILLSTWSGVLSAWAAYLSASGGGTP